MARYVDDYQGISGHRDRARGMDPNYRGGYGGMRMRAEEGQAAYGAYRVTHPQAFQGSGGVAGRYAPRHGSGRPERGQGGYDREWGGGGVRELRRDPDAMREFNARSPMLRDRGYDREQRPLGRGPERDRFGYSNRGISSAGYAESWAWGPMRGAR